MKLPHYSEGFTVDAARVIFDSQEICTKCLAVGAWKNGNQLVMKLMRCKSFLHSMSLLLGQRTQKWLVVKWLGHYLYWLNVSGCLVHKCHCTVRQWNGVERWLSSWTSVSLTTERSCPVASPVFWDALPVTHASDCRLLHVMAQGM